MAKAEKGGGNNLTRQHYQVASGKIASVAGKHNVMPPQGSYSFNKGAKVAPKSSRR